MHPSWDFVGIEINEDELNDMAEKIRRQLNNYMIVLLLLDALARFIIGLRVKRKQKLLKN